MDNLQAAPITMCTSKATLAAGTTTTLSNTGTVLFCIRGKAYSHAALSNTATPTTDHATGAAFVPVPANKGSIFMVGFNAAGTLKVAQGTVESLDASGAFINAPQWGPMPTDFCPIGYLIVKVGATYVATTSGWLFGTHNNSSVTGVTYTFGDLMSITDRPQIS